MNSRNTDDNSLNAVCIPSRNFNPFVTHFPECLRKQKLTSELHNIVQLMQFSYKAEISKIMLQNVLENTNRLKSYVIFPRLMQFSYLAEISALFKVMFANVSERENVVKSYLNLALDVVSIQRRNLKFFLTHFLECLIRQNWTRSYVISDVLCSFYTKQKFQVFFKFCSKMSQKEKIVLKIAKYLSLDVVLIKSKNLKRFWCHVPECLIKQKWT